MSLSGPLGRLSDLQAGVLARRQLLAAGLCDNDVRRLLRRRELVRVHPGVYLTHTGPPTWLQRAWAAVLWAEPAALCGQSARRAADGPGRIEYDDGQPIHVAIAHERAIDRRSGVIVHRKRHLDEEVLWNTAPPRQRVEEAVLDLAITAEDRLDAIAHLADVLGGRLSLPDRLAAALARRPRVTDRAFLDAVIADVATGTCSVLEHGYLTLVERPHGLPTAARQFRDSAKGPLYRDARYAAYDTNVELDGRLFHSRVHDRDRDLERDLDAAVDGSVTARLGWGQVYGRPCATADKIGRLLVSRGWSGRPRTCPSCPRAAA